MSKIAFELMFIQVKLIKFARINITNIIQQDILHILHAKWNTLYCKAFVYSPCLLIYTNDISKNTCKMAKENATI